MTMVRRFTPKNRLADLIHKPGGLRASDAIAAAERNLEGLRDEAMDRLDAVLAELEALAAGADARVRLDDMYRLSNEIVGVAGVFGYGPMGEAAYSLCELLDHLRAKGGWSPEGVAVHLQTLELLRSRGGPSADPAHCAAILEGLRKVAARSGQPS